MVRRNPKKFFSTKLKLRRPTKEDKKGYETARENDIDHIELMTLQTPFEEKEDEERKDRAY